MDWNNRHMTPQEYDQARKDLGMSQAGVGRFLGFSERKSRRLARGDVAVPAAVALLLRLLIEDGHQPIVPKKGEL